MNRRWNRLSRFGRLFFLFCGLVNLLSLGVQFFYGNVFSWWLSGVGNGFYLAYAYLLFSKHDSGCPIEDCSNVDCPHYSA